MDLNTFCKAQQVNNRIDMLNRAVKDLTARLESVKLGEFPESVRLEWLDCLSPCAYHIPLSTRDKDTLLCILKGLLTTLEQQLEKANQEFENL